MLRMIVILCCGFTVCAKAQHSDTALVSAGVEADPVSAKVFMNRVQGIYDMCQALGVKTAARTAYDAPVLCFPETKGKARYWNKRVYSFCVEPIPVDTTEKIGHMEDEPWQITIDWNPDHLGYPTHTIVILWIYDGLESEGDLRCVAVEKVWESADKVVFTNGAVVTTQEVVRCIDDLEAMMKFIQSAEEKKP